MFGKAQTTQTQMLILESHLSDCKIKKKWSGLDSDCLVLKTDSSLVSQNCLWFDEGFYIFIEKQILCADVGFDFMKLLMWALKFKQLDT